MNDKLSTYYSLVNGFALDKPKDFCYIDESEKEEINIFKEFCPISISILMRDIKYIVNDMCEKLISKEEVIKTIDNIKKSKEATSAYKWKDVDLKELLNGDYQYLIDKFIFKIALIPNINFFVNNYKYPLDPVFYDFSLKELYHKLLDRGIQITINNYFLCLKTK